MVSVRASVRVQFRAWLELGVGQVLRLTLHLRLGFGIGLGLGLWLF